MGQPFEMRVELGKVREFARATGSHHPDYLEGENPPAPVTFLMTSAFWQTPDSFAFPEGVNLARLLHGGQEFVYPDGPPEAGTILTGQMRVGDTTVKEGKRGGTMTIRELITDFHDEDGRLVAQSITTSIETSQPTGAQ